MADNVFQRCRNMLETEEVPGIGCKINVNQKKQWNQSDGDLVVNILA